MTGSQNIANATSATKEETLASLKQQRASAKGSITRIKNLLDSDPNRWNAIDLECRLDLVTSYIKQVMSYQTEVEKLDPTDDKRAGIEDLCMNTKAQLLTMLGRNRSRDSTILENSISIAPLTRLPNLKLPQFSGKYSEYKNFISTFKSLVDSESSLAPIEKFNHLLSCLTGDALLTVKAFQVTAENYPKALTRLADRYDKSCLIFFDSVAQIFDIEKMTKPNASELRKAVDTVSALFDSLLSLGSEKDVANALIIHLVISKVDYGTKAKWNDQLDYSKLPTWTECSKVLIRRCQTLEVNEEKTSKPDTSKNFNKKKSENKSSLACSSESSDFKCAYCKSSEHYIQKCSAFQAMKFANKSNFAKENSLCFKCLRKGHSASKCNASNCRHCKGPHSSLLHRFPETQSSQVSSNVGVASLEPLSQTPPSLNAQNHPIQQENVSLNENSSSTVMHVQTDDKVVMLATALVKARDKFGNFVTLRALLDSGSQTNFISEEYVHRLQLKRDTTSVNISGIGETNSSVCQKAYVTIKSKTSEFEFDSEFLVIKSITRMQPERNISVDSWNLPPNIRLADPWFYKRQKVDLLIGAEVFFDLLQAGQIKLTDSLPILQKTQLGWIVSGTYSPTDCEKSCHLNVLKIENHEKLDTLVKRFWELEEIPHIASYNSKEHELCEQHFKTHVKLLPAGRLEVALPFKHPPSHLGSSFEAARRRFFALELRLKKSPEILSMYNDFMKEYLNLGHMSPLKSLDKNSPHYFIPHQVVLRPQSTTTKLRVVFDASCKTPTQFSLNDTLMVGPTIQPELYNTLIRFRCHKFAITADITKMYRQVLVRESDRQFQLILWRENDTLPVQTFQLNTVTYGTASAPFLAIRSLFELSDLFNESLPIGAKILKNDFYVDDMLSGADSFEELEVIREQVCEILEKGGFKLAKWFSNHNTYMKQACEKALKFNDGDSTKTLGITWLPKNDTLNFSLPDVLEDHEPTKRSILSMSARLFDPLGLLGPLVVRSKILLQDLWALKIDWDEPIPQKIKNKWQMFKHEMQEINTLKIPRYVNTTKTMKIQIHGFSDASARAYGCCIYVRLEQNGQIQVRLLTAKSKVAPLRTKTLPRLELCAAHTLSKLWKNIEPDIAQFVENVTFWSDSEIVLYWLKNHASDLNIFVANRVSDIQEWSDTATWRYVPTKENPADLISRGCSTSDLKSSIWFEGPNFLKQQECQWPVSKRPELSIEDAKLEKRKCKTTLAAVNTEKNIIIELIERCSTFNKVIRVVAFIYRMLIKRKEKTKNLTAKELELAFLKTVQLVQNYDFGNEIKLLENSQILQPHLQKLTPFLQKYNDHHRNITLIHVGGRLLNAPDSAEVKFPLLLKRDSRFSLLYLTHLHFKNYHIGPKNLLNLSKQRVWIVNGRSLARKVVRKCIHCFKYKPKLQNQIMGHLPPDRLRNVRPFLIVGVDFCGPINTSLRIRGRPPYKTYIAIFICFTSKAIHIETATELSTNAFLLVFKRFIARRGLPERVYCDNATNFVGASNVIKKMHEKLFNETNINDIEKYTAHIGVKFAFIPPRAPHFGGLWEAAVRSAKTLLLKTIGDANLTLEELQTVLAEIEAVLNSRPISQSEDPNDGEAITPGHMLIGDALKALPEPVDTNKDQVTYAKRWQLIAHLKARFWTLFRRDYVSELQSKTKWATPQRNVSVGELVVIHEDNAPPQQWLTGRITSVVTGVDGKVRVAEIKTKNGIIKRPIHKLAALPIEN